MRCLPVNPVGYVQRLLLESLRALGRRIDLQRFQGVSQCFVELRSTQSGLTGFDCECERVRPSPGALLIDSNEAKITGESGHIRVPRIQGIDTVQQFCNEGGLPTLDSLPCFCDPFGDCMLPRRIHLGEQRTRSRDQQSRTG